MQCRHWRWLLFLTADCDCCCMRCCTLSYTATTCELARPIVDTRVAQLRAVVTKLWDWCAVEVYGSFASGLWLPNSDIDVVVMVRMLHTVASLCFVSSLPVLPLPPLATTFVLPSFVPFRAPHKPMPTRSPTLSTACTAWLTC